MVKENPNKNINKTFKMLKPGFIKELLGAQKEKTINVKNFSKYYNKKYN